MADFPSARHHLPVISSFGVESASLAGAASATVTGNLGTSTVWPTANLAYYVPVRIWSPYLVNRLWWANGSTATGNIDCGIYTVGGTLLTSAGSTAQSGTSTIQTVTPTALLLLPGSYYLAMAASSTSTTVMAVVSGVAAFSNAGWAQQASALPLPVTATFAALATSPSFLPLFGIARTTVI